MKWPEWWQWDLEVSSHIEKRMEDRDFTEVDVRQMLEEARGYAADVVEGRWIVATRFRDQSWEVIVETDMHRKLLVLVTAYPVEG